MPNQPTPALAPAPTAAKSSKAARKRRKAKQKKAADSGPAVKPGAKSNFRGERAEFVDHWYYKFLLVKGQPQKVHDAFWSDLYAAYWERFPWHLPLDRDPYEPMPPPPEETPEVLLEKEEVVTKTQDRLQGHLRYRATTAARKDRNPWHWLVSKLHQQANPPPVPRKLALWQHLMHKKHNEIQVAFAERWPAANLPDREQVNFRGIIARELLAQQSEEYVKELQVEVDAMHDLDMAAYEAEMVPTSGVPQDEEHKAMARANFAPIVTPLLKLLRVYTGYYITLICGVPLPEGEKEFDIKVMNEGKASKGATWHGVEGSTFSGDVMPSFTRFLMSTEEYVQRQASHQDPEIPEPQASTSNAAEPGPSSAGLYRIENASSPPPPPKKKKGKTKPTPRGKAADDSDSAIDTEPGSGSSSDDEEDELAGDEDEGAGAGAGEDEGEDEDEDEGEEYDDEEIPAGAIIPTAEDLGLNDAMGRKLDAMGDNERKVFLWLHRNKSDWEIECLNTQASNKEMFEKLGLALPAHRVDKGKGKEVPRRRAPKTQAAPTEPRRSSRLNPASSEHPTVGSSAQNGAHMTPSPPAGPSGSSAQVALPSDARASGAMRSDLPAPPTQSCPPSATFSGDNAPPAAPTPSIGTTLPAAPTTSSAASALPAALAPGTSSADSAPPPAPAPSSSPSPAPTPAPAPAPGTSAADSAPPVVPVPPAAPVPTPPPVAPATSAANGSAPPAMTAVTINYKDWPEWVQDAFNFLDNIDCGSTFDRALALWTEVERTYKWESSKTGLSAKGRPAAVGHWIRHNRRDFAKTPPIPSESAYARSWWDWWTALQPSWRPRDTRGRPVPGGQGSWDGLNIPGKNGMLMVLLSLVWWNEVAADSRADWNAAVDDVTWALEALLQDARSRRGIDTQDDPKDEVMPDAAVEENR